jgi:hypothetical protein
MHRLHVEVEGEVDVLFRRVKHGAVVDKAGDIDEHIQPAELLGDGIGERVDILGRADVESEALRCLQPRKLAVVYVSRDDGRVFVDEGRCNGTADALAGGCDQCHLALQPSRHGTLMYSRLVMLFLRALNGRS